MGLFQKRKEDIYRIGMKHTKHLNDIAGDNHLIFNYTTKHSVRSIDPIQTKKTGLIACLFLII